MSAVTANNSSTNLISTDFENSTASLSNEDIFEPTNKKSDKPKQMRLGPDLVKQLEEKDIDELCCLAKKYVKYHCLVADDKAEFDLAYQKYQKEVLNISIKHRVEVTRAQQYVGTLNRFRGSSNYNNFCQFAPKERKVFGDGLSF